MDTFPAAFYEQLPKGTRFRTNTQHPWHAKAKDDPTYYGLVVQVHPDDLPQETS